MLLSSAVEEKDTCFIVSEYYKRPLFKSMERFVSDLRMSYNTPVAIEKINNRRVEVIRSLPKKETLYKSRVYQNDPNTLMCYSTFNSRKEAEEVLKILEQDYPFYNWKIEVDHVLKHYLDAPFAPKLSPSYKIWGTVEKDRVDIMYEEFLRIYERNDYVEMVKFLDKLSNDRAKDLLNKIMRDLYARK